jgi:hypothetical protein
MEFEAAASFVESQAGPLMHPSPTSGNGILGFAVGRKDEGPLVGTPPGKFCVTVYVARKLSPGDLAERGIAEAQELCRGAGRNIGISFDDADLNVVEVGDEFRVQAYSGSSHANPPAANTQKWFLALRPGIGIANPTASYPGSLEGGTLGFFVRPKTGTSLYLVSCNHVIALERTSASSSVPREVIVQPATMDLSGRDISTFGGVIDLEVPFGIAKLHDYVPVALHGAALPHPPNEVDAAIAELDLPDGTGGRELDELARLPFCGRILGLADDWKWDKSAKKVVGSKYAYKVGRTTGYTEGYVAEINATIDVNFAKGKALFVNQIAIKATPDNTGMFSAQGDSGSPLLNDRHELAGMIFSGGPTRSLANKISIVKTELEKLVGHLTLIT